MSAKQFQISVGDEKIDAFIYEGVLALEMASSSLHCHRYAEVHFTERGQCRLFIDGDELLSQSGTVTVIPKGIVHRLKITDPDTVHGAFLINYPMSAVLQKKISPDIMGELGAHIRAYRKTKDFNMISAYLSFICKDVVRAKTELRSVKNQEFLIYEFFANRYNENVSLCDLAKELKVCEKQCARLVLKYMGAPFSKILLDHRMNAAKQLLTGDPSLTMSEVAELVGYRSYSGFWKAFKKLG